ncbi:MAG TPA: hypothetical protein VFB51_00745 [Solirubrobacterales bacterium]|nr:hypothetical protein [Solirubrobacterales bacterium]
MKRLSLLVAVFALALPAVTTAKGGAAHTAAAKQCKAMRAEMGAEAFRAAFAKHGKRAMKRCVAAQRKANAAAKRRAKKACRAEGKRGRALKRCVRGKLQAPPVSEVAEDYKAALEDCKAAREEDPEGFAEQYGEGAEGLEQCVTELADDSQDENADDDDLVEEEPGEDEVVDEPESEPEPGLELV